MIGDIFARLQSPIRASNDATRHIVCRISTPRMIASITRERAAVPLEIFGVKWKSGEIAFVNPLQTAQETKYSLNRLRCNKIQRAAKK